MNLDERHLVQEHRDRLKKELLEQIEEYDSKCRLSMLSKGYVLKNRAKRTVLFLFGELTFYRNRWYKDENVVMPVDEWLGLEKYSRLSKEVEYLILDLVIRMSYRQVVDVLSELYGISVTKNLIANIIKKGKRLLDSKRDFDEYIYVECSNKECVDLLYIEGDDVFIKKTDKTYMHLFHYVVHLGSYRVDDKRYALKQKREFVAKSLAKAKQEMVVYLKNRYRFTENTLLITNSDGGAGFSYRSFCNIAKDLAIKKHEHFWDEFHILQEVRLITRKHLELRKQFFKAIYHHNRQSLNIALDTLESLLESNSDIEQFEKFSKKIRANFRYTKPAHLRDIPKGGIGIIESNHRKLTYRMKNRGMYWSNDGAETIARLIILEKQGELRDLIFGEWRKADREIKQIEQNYSWREANREVRKSYDQSHICHLDLDILKTGRI